MSGKVAKRLRKEAEKLTVNEPGSFRRVYKILKYNYKVYKKFSDNR